MSVSHISSPDFTEEELVSSYWDDQSPEWQDHLAEVADASLAEYLAEQVMEPRHLHLCHPLGSKR